MLLRYVQQLDPLRRRAECLLVAGLEALSSPNPPGQFVAVVWVHLLGGVVGVARVYNAVTWPQLIYLYPPVDSNAQLANQHRQAGRQADWQLDNSDSRRPRRRKNRMNQRNRSAKQETEAMA